MPRNVLSSGHQARQSGFTLLEVLVSMLILSIGIFGSLKMHLASIHSFQQTTHFRTALILATELSDHLLGNPPQLPSATTSRFLKINYQARSDQIESAASCIVTECSPEQLAAAQISEWLRKITSALPNARAVVCRDDVIWNAVRQQLEWPCHAAGDRSPIVIKMGWADSTAQTDAEGLPPQLAIPVGVPQ